MLRDIQQKMNQALGNWPVAVAEYEQVHHARDIAQVLCANEGDTLQVEDPQYLDMFTQLTDTSKAWVVDCTKLYGDLPSPEYSQADFHALILAAFIADCAIQ